jgi:chorismate mutase/prephenate dehydratase
LSAQAMTDTSDGDLSTATAPTLATLRARIDEIDAEVHTLLIERSTVIDALIRAKGKAQNGSAFRPAREADIMRRLADRHSGSLPISSVEHLWREIIGTFTNLQAPFRVHVAGLAAADGAMRDLARFQFGFDVELVPAADAEAAAAAVVAEPRDLALVPLDAAPATAWWRALGPGGARIIARLPFLVTQGPGARPALVLSGSDIDEPPTEVECLASTLDTVPDGAALAAAGIELMAAVGNDVLLARRRSPAAAALGLHMRAAGGYAAPSVPTATR